MKTERGSSDAIATSGGDIVQGGAGAGTLAPLVPDERAIPEPTYLPPGAAPKRRTLLMQAAVDTFAQRGARIGSYWIAAVIFLAVFAPFLANSFPIAMKLKTGEWRFPLFAALFPLDVVLLVAFFAAIALMLWRRFSFGTSLLILTGVIAVATPLAMWLTNPPKNIVYEDFRQRQAAGEIVKAIHTIVPYSANDRLNDRPGDRLQRPGRIHWLGTTIFGEDMLSRMIHACRVALSIGFIATTISAVIGIIIGGLMGYFAGTTDLLVMRVIEIVQAIPRLILLLIVTASFGRNIYLMMITIGLVSWPAEARYIRAEFLKLRKQDFVQAGIAAGLPLRSILFRHMLPNGVAPVLVEASFGIAGAILLESTLSFLGLGLAPEDPSWGQLLNQARTGGGFSWWIATFPGLAIFLTVFAYILIGEAMRDALDPKLRKQELSVASCQLSVARTDATDNWQLATGN
jgi:peptide/nickel transport system permease protein